MADDNTPKLPKKAGTELGQSGTLIFQGFITGEEYNQRLLGRNAIRIYEIMRRSDSTIRSMLQACKLPILGTTWAMEPASDEPEDIYNADFITDQLFGEKIVWHDFLRDTLTMMDFGYSVFEKVLNLTEFQGKTRIGIDKLAPRKQVSILKWATPDGEPGITQILPGKTIGIDMDKLIVFTNDKEGDNYQGVSLLRYAYKSWDIKDKLDLVNAIALERQAIGIPKLTKTANVVIGEPELEKARQSLRQMRANEESFIETPEGVDVEFMDMKAQTTKEVIPTLQYLDRQITRSVLAQFLELGSQKGGGGSKALSADHSQLFEKSLQSVANTILSTVQNQLIKQLCDLNFTNLPNGYPKLTFGTIGDDDTEALSTAVAALMTAGALTPDADLENDLRTKMRLPELPEDVAENYADRKLPNQPIAPAPTDPNDPAKPKPDSKLPVDDKEKTKLEAARRDATRATRNLIDIVNRG